MKLGDLVHVINNVTGGGRVRRAARRGETGVLIETHYINDLRMTSLVWCDVMMSDGLITLPAWCLRPAEEQDGVLDVSAVTE